MEMRTRPGEFKTIVPFQWLCDFSVQYMLEHAYPAGNARNPAEGLVYLLDARGTQIRNGLVDNNFDWVALEETVALGRERLHNRDWLYWRGFTADCPYNFRWRSCTMNQLDATRCPDRPGWFAVECIIFSGCRTCGFKDALAEFGAVWEPVELPEARFADQEPDWGSNEYRLERVGSGC